MVNKKILNKHLPNLSEMDKEELGSKKGGGCVRLNLGRFYTKNELEERRQLVLSKKL